MQEKDILDSVNKLIYTYGLNKVIRYKQDRNEIHQTQSVAEHVTNILFCVYHFRDIVDPNCEMDIERVVRLILMHDMGEIETGDIITTLKNKDDCKKELEAIKIVASNSPDFIKHTIEENFLSFENPKTKEERFAKAMDKFEGLLFWFTDDGIKMIRSVSGGEAIENYFKKLKKHLIELEMPEVLQYVEVMHKDMMQRGLML